MIGWLRLPITITTDETVVAGFVDLPMGGPNYADVVRDLLALDLSVATVVLGEDQ